MTWRLFVIEIRSKQRAGSHYLLNNKPQNELYGTQPLCKRDSRWDTQTEAFIYIQTLFPLTINESSPRLLSFRRHIPNIPTQEPTNHPLNSTQCHAQHSNRNRNRNRKYKRT
jgi:hypothetical protein